MMHQVLQNYRTGEVRVDDVPAPTTGLPVQIRYPIASDAIAGVSSSPALTSPATAEFSGGTTHRLALDYFFAINLLIRSWKLTKLAAAIGMM
jgi:hypothetical protein